MQFVFSQFLESNLQLAEQLIQMESSNFSKQLGLKEQTSLLIKYILGLIVLSQQHKKVFQQKEELIKVAQ
jgi:hypothetical protein